MCISFFLLNRPLNFTKTSRRGIGPCENRSFLAKNWAFVMHWKIGSFAFCSSTPLQIRLAVIKLSGNLSLLSEI